MHNDPVALELELEADALRGHKVRPLDPKLMAHMVASAKTGLEAIAGLAFILGLPGLLMVILR